MIKKLAMLATVTAGLFMGANVAGNIPQQQKAPLDARLIVELDRPLSSLSEEGIKNVQDSLISRIRSEVTSNVKVLSNYTVLNNAVGIAVNSQYVDQITNLSGVKSVTKDKLHVIQSTGGYTARISLSDAEHDYGGPDNISAETMEKPDNTNDGEGTVIAIIDNEFYFRAKHSEKNEAGEEVVVPSWHHETFTSFEELGETVVQRYVPQAKYVQGKTVYIAPKEFESTKHAHAYKKKQKLENTPVGEEGSLYFNSKVPFYFDYGGETPVYGDSYTEDFDVTSASDYHGSHVASTAAGHAEFYKGIAPKAQLVCMKASTEFRSTSFTDAMGLTSFSGFFEMPILNALEDAIDLGVDGINMSLGSNLDDFDSDSITLKTLTRLSNSGILSAISAGNAGKTSYSSLGGYANWTSEMTETGIISSYVNNHSTTSVASAQPTKIFYTQALKVATGNEIGFVAFEDQVVNREGLPKEFKDEHPLKDLFPETTTQYDWQYVPGFGTAADYTGLDVRGKIAVVNRGSTSFADKYTVAKNMSAVALAVINNDPTANDFNFRFSFGDTKPDIPVVSVLFKDKGYFDGTKGNKSGTITLAKDEIFVNDKEKTSSTFTSDGIAYDLELKPDISSPGDFIRGAVPPQNKEDKADRPLRSYAFLSGTSMAAPNYAGAQSVLLSKEAKGTYGNEPGAMSKDELAAYKATIDMRYLSTANPMLDAEDCPENPGHKTLTSPRIQGAGLVDMGGAYRTDVYLEGADAATGEKTGKAKLSLKNYEAINNGRLDLKFYSHNESEENRTYNAYLTVMRPAIKNDNGVVTKDYTFRAEIDDITAWATRTYWVETVDPVTSQRGFVQRTAPGEVKDKDYYKVSREIEYYATELDIYNAFKDQEDGTWTCSECGELHIAGSEDHCPNCGADQEHHTEDFLTRIPVGKYMYDSTSEEKWVTLPGYDYQSTQDVYIEEKLPLGEMTFAPGEEFHQIDSYSLSSTVKEDILSFYEYGCYIEGYVTFESTQSKEDLNLVYVGFFAGGERTYQDAPVVEPFNFEKSSSKVYPSDLVNDVAKTLVGKDLCDFGSTWIVGYVESGKSFSTESFEYNDNSLSNLAKTSSSWHFLGEDPFTGKLAENAKDHLYVGNPYTSNTMIIQQFILRSVADNYFTIVNRETGEMVYKSCMIDAAMSYGYMGKWPLYKSHVNGDRLGSYIADKALAVVPLYDSETGEPFPDGEYDITFNYLLAGTNEWTGDKYQYTLVIDSTAPKITGVTHNSAEHMVRLDIEEENISYASFGGISGGLTEIHEDEKGKYIEIDEDYLLTLLEDNINETTDYTGRLFLSLMDNAFGRTGVIVRFKYSFKTHTYDFDNYIMGQHANLQISHDLIDLGTYVQVIEVDDTEYHPVTDEDIAKFTTFMRNGQVVEHVEYIPVTTSGCGGNVAATSIVLSTLSLSAIVLLTIARKKKKIGGK